MILISLSLTTFGTTSVLEQSHLPFVYTINYKGTRGLDIHRVERHGNLAWRLFSRCFLFIPFCIMEIMIFQNCEWGVLLCYCLTCNPVIIYGFHYRLSTNGFLCWKEPSYVRAKHDVTCYIHRPGVGWGGPASSTPSMLHVVVSA